VAAYESQQRMERRRQQRLRERWECDPDYVALRRWVEQRRRYLTRHPWANCPSVILQWFCRCWGMTLGGRPPKARRCTKRLGSRFCWG
jgi:hypothetical protein